MKKVFYAMIVMALVTVSSAVQAQQNYVASGLSASRDGLGAFAQFGTVLPVANGWGIHAFVGGEFARRKTYVHSTPVGDSLYSFERFYAGGATTTQGNFSGFAGIGPAYTFGNGVMLALNGSIRYTGDSGWAVYNRQRYGVPPPGMSHIMSSTAIPTAVSSWQFGISLAAMIPLTALDLKVPGAFLFIEGGLHTTQKVRVQYVENREQAVLMGQSAVRASSPRSWSPVLMIGLGFRF